MIAFAPGELSTYAKALDNYVLSATGDDKSYTSVYNFRDLPCPPMSVMVESLCDLNTCSMLMLGSVRSVV